MKKKDKFLWIRVGDNDNYNKVDQIEEAAETLYNSGVRDELVRCETHGITDHDLFANLNYISLFYGDDDAQAIKPISNKELKRLNECIERADCF